MTKMEILFKLNVEEKGFFIKDDEFEVCADLDATFARKYLESKGFKVIDNKDYGNCGRAKFICGSKIAELSTNGYCYIKRQ